MNNQPNALRIKLAAGNCVVGAAVFSWSPNVIDAAVLAGLDYVRIDTEHASRKDDSLEHLIRAAIMGGIVPIVRVDGDDSYLVRKALAIVADSYNTIRQLRFHHGEMTQKELAKFVGVSRQTINAPEFS